MDYLQLLPNAEFSYYGKDGCVFDLFNNNSFYCNKEIALGFNSLLNGMTYEKDKCDKELVTYIEKLMDEGLVYIYSQPVFHESFYEKNKQEIRGLFEEPPIMNNIFIQGSEQCGYNCNFCDKKEEKYIVNHSCRSCILWGNIKKNMS